MLASSSPPRWCFQPFLALGNPYHQADSDWNPAWGVRSNPIFFLCKKTWDPGSPSTLRPSPKLHLRYTPENPKNPRVFWRPWNPGICIHVSENKRISPENWWLFQLIHCLSRWSRFREHVNEPFETRNPYICMGNSSLSMSIPSTSACLDFLGRQKITASFSHVGLPSKSSRPSKEWSPGIVDEVNYYD